jgi:hypothetical protein
LALELKLVHQPFSGCQYQDSVAGFVSKRWALTQIHERGHMSQILSIHHPC